MTQKDNSGAYQTQAAITAGFSFAVAAFAVGLGLLEVLARIGLPDAALRFCVGAMIFAGLVVIAARLRTMRPAEFYAGGRNLPPSSVALAYAGFAAGLFLPFLPPLPPGAGFFSLAMGFAVGLVCALCFTGPFLRRSAAFSIADLVGIRFPHAAVRCIIALTAALCAILIGLAGYDIALRAFVATTGLDRGLGLLTVGALLILLIVPGGLSGVIWLGTGAAVVTLTALGLPAVLTLSHGTPDWTAGLARLDQITGTTAAPFSLPVVLTLALGLSALAPLFGPSVASGGRIPALRAGPLAVFFIGALAFLSVLACVQSVAALDTTGAQPAKVPPQILASADSGLSLCGTQSNNPDEIAAHCRTAQPGLGKTGAPQDIGASAASLIENLPILKHYGPVLAGLAGIFAMILGMAVAAAGIQSFATSLGHDIYHPRRRRFGPVSRRLAVARALTIGLIACCGAYLAHHGADPRRLVLLATVLSAALITPVMVLTFVKRAGAFDAGAALIVAAALLAHYFYTHPHGWKIEELAVNTVFAALDATFAGFFASLLHGREPLPARPALPPPGRLVGPD